MTLSKFAAVSAIVASATCGTALAQVPEGRLYVFHSSAQGGCPALDWHVVVEPGNKLSGMIAWNNMQSMAHATGTVSNGHVMMTAKEVGGRQRTATVDGTVRGDGWFTVNIKGPGVSCSNINIPFYSAPQSAG